MQKKGQKEVIRGAIAGSLLRILGHRLWGARITDTGVLLLGRRERHVAFSEIAGPAYPSRVFSFHGIALPLSDGSLVRIAGLKHSNAADFVDATNRAWRRFLSAFFKASATELQVLSEAVDRLAEPRRYPSACLLQPFVERAEALLPQAPCAALDAIISDSQVRMLRAARKLQEAPQRLRDAAIKSFVDAELNEMSDFLDTIEAHPLTPEQRLAVVTDEDATLVLAGAGSGKTSVIVAKAAYLIRKGIRRPDEVLLLAFGKDAAEEMASRIEERCGSPVDARTFHALGYEIIRKVEGQGPAPAPHASDDAQFRALLREILVSDVAKQKGIASTLLRWFSEFYWPRKSEWDFETKDEYYQYVEAHELRTLQGELVRSFEELEIANWLYLNGIAYEYEPLYEHDLPENDRRAYMPDFRLTESGVYIEHFGLRKSEGPTGRSTLTTAPHVDRESYLAGMAWKKKVHRDHGTTLVETYSYERVEGSLTEALEEKLAPYVTPNPIPPEQVFEILSEMGQIDAFTQTLGTFLRHFKSAGLMVEQCRERAAGSADTPRNLAFLKIFEPVLEAYERRLGERIDFEDMIVRATEHVRSGRYRSPYRHLLVDEFQDISEGRAKLLLALKEQHSDARIFAVGDDWQSIYRFTGSDIHLMRNFGEEFGGHFAGASGIHRSVDLGRTFRSVDKIALPARHFVLQNPSQIQKRVIPAGTVSGAAIKVAYSARGQEAASLRSVLDDLYASEGDQGKASVLLLGRYRFLKPDNLQELVSNYPALSIRFMTVHSSKGLEADHVVILRATSGRMGFPSEIVDDPVLNMALPEPEEFDHAEERRLFYVALTRARKSVTILADREKPSAFVRELVENEDYEVVETGGRGRTSERCQACGGRMLAQTSQNGQVRFACEHRFLCGAISKACSVCKANIPVREKSDPENMVCQCGARFPACPECESGWLVERAGRYGKFLGCVNYPTCNGTRQLSAKKRGRTLRPRWRSKNRRSTRGSNQRR